VSDGCGQNHTGSADPAAKRRKGLILTPSPPYIVTADAQALHDKGPESVKDDIWMRDEVQSPCVKLCVVHPEERICVGCFRSIEEISTWSRMTHEERAAIMADLPARSPRLAKRRGGRMGRLDR
jgi:predicted Fe-S protein YdhL (DUF1289 family)